MNKKKDSIVLVVITLIISMIGLAIAFATFSRTLVINGNAEVASSVWDIHFSSTEGGNAGGTITPSLSNINGYEITSTASVGNFNATQLSWTGTVKTFGDKIEFVFYIVNSGDCNAKISSLTKNNLICKVNNTVETSVCSNLDYKFTYRDGSEVKNGDTLNAGESKEVILTLLYDNKTGTNPSTSDIVTIDQDSLTITILYVQD